MALPEPRARVRLTDDAVADLRRLHRKDPQVVREVFKKMLLLERAVDAGEPLLGPLVGFRKLVVGDRHYRIVWRRTADESQRPVLDIAEVWAAAVRADGEIYEEMARRVQQLKDTGGPETRPLIKVIEGMGRLFSDIEAQPEPSPNALPAWLVQALRESLHLSSDDIAQLNQIEAQQLLTEYWSKPRQ